MKKLPACDDQCVASSEVSVATRAARRIRCAHYPPARSGRIDSPCCLNVGLGGLTFRTTDQPKRAALASTARRVRSQHIGTYAARATEPSALWAASSCRRGSRARVLGQYMRNIGMNSPSGAGNQFDSLSVSGRILLEVQGDRTVGVGFQVVARTDGELVQLVRHEPPAVIDHVHCDGPETVDGRRLPLGESQRVLVGAGERFSTAVDQRVG